MTPSLVPQSPQQGTAGTAAAFGGQKEVVGGGGGWQEPLGSCGRAPGDREGGREGMKLEEKGQKPRKGTQAAQLPAQRGCWWLLSTSP